MKNILEIECAAIQPFVLPMIRLLSSHPQRMALFPEDNQVAHWYLSEFYLPYLSSL